MCRVHWTWVLWAFNPINPKPWKSNQHDSCSYTHMVMSGSKEFVYIVLYYFSIPHDHDFYFPVTWISNIYQILTLCHYLYGFGREPEGHITIQWCFNDWQPEGHYRHRLWTVIAPFWFSTEHHWIVISYNALLALNWRCQIWQYKPWCYLLLQQKLLTANRGFKPESGDKIYICLTNIQGDAKIGALIKKYQTLAYSLF